MTQKSNGFSEVFSLDNTDIHNNIRSGGHAVCTNQRIVIVRKPVRSVFSSLVIMGLFILLQFAVSFPYFFVQIVNALAENNMDSALAYNSYVSNISGNGSGTLITVITTLVSTIVAVLCYRFIFCKHYSTENLKATCRRVFKPRIIIGLAAATFAVFIISNFVASFTIALFPAKGNEYRELMELGISDINTFPIFLSICILAPINEECIMRGMILTKLKKNMPAAAAIIICAILFGIFHMNFIQSIYVLPAGALLAYVAWKYDSVIPSMLVHALYNGMNYITEILPDALSESPVFLIAVMVVCAAAWVFTEARVKKDLPADNRTAE